MKKILITFLFFLLNVPLPARDIDLDRIYIDPNDTLYSQLTAIKDKTYSDISSLPLDSRVIYAEWANGDDIVYIKEYENVNIAFIYNRAQGRKNEIARFPGTVTSSSLNSTKDSLIAKTLEYTASGTSAFIYFINLGKKTVIKKSSPYYFLDYTLLPGSDSILLYAGRGLVRFSPEGGEKELLFTPDRYRELQRSGEAVLAFISPDNRKHLFVTGSGGSYDARLVTSSVSSGVPGISSASDLCWIDNNRFAYCGGSAGEYSVNIYDSSAAKKAVLVSGTLNPDINFSREAGILTYLDNQMIILFTVREFRGKSTGLEGEEVYFSPDGRKFTSIYRGRLYVTSLNMLQKNRIAVRGNAEKILSMYKSAMTKKQVWLNDYSKNYIEKKYKLYENFIRTME